MESPQRQRKNRAAIEAVLQDPLRKDRAQEILDEEQARGPQMTSAEHRAVDRMLREGLITNF